MYYYKRQQQQGLPSPLPMGVHRSIVERMMEEQEGELVGTRARQQSCLHRILRPNVGCAQLRTPEGLWSSVRSRLSTKVDFIGLVG